MKISRKIVKIDSIHCPDRGKKFNSRIDKLAWRISQEELDRVLTVYPIVVRMTDRRLILIAGERTFLWVRARRNADAKIPVIEVSGKDIDVDAFLATDDILGPLLFGADAAELQILTKGHVASGVIHRIGHDLGTPKDWQDILKPEAKRRGRKSKSKDGTAGAISGQASSQEGDSLAPELEPSGNIAAGITSSVPAPASDLTSVRDAHPDTTSNDTATNAPIAGTYGYPPTQNLVHGDSSPVGAPLNDIPQLIASGGLGDSEPKPVPSELALGSESASLLPPDSAPSGTASSKPKTTLTDSEPVKAKQAKRRRPRKEVPPTTENSPTAIGDGDGDGDGQASDTAKGAEDRPGPSDA